MYASVFIIINLSELYQSTTLYSPSQLPPFPPRVFGFICYTGENMQHIVLVYNFVQIANTQRINHW